VRRSLLGNGERDGVPELARRGWDEEVVRRWGGREAERETTPACLPACLCLRRRGWWWWMDATRREARMAWRRRYMWAARGGGPGLAPSQAKQEGGSEERSGGQASLA
jgi:hypothetical protein